MKNLVILTFILFFYQAILKNTEENNKKYYKNYNYEFLEFINSFEKQFTLKVDVPINFLFLNDDTAGLCVNHNGSPNILISYSYWNEISKSQKEELIYHELGHCIFRLGHDDRRIMLNLCPNSIMNSRGFDFYESKICYILFKKHYIADFYEKISIKNN